MTKSLALDASTTDIGYVFSVDDKIIRIHNYQPKGDDVHERIADFDDWLSAMIVTFPSIMGEKGMVDVVFYEYPSGTKYHKSSLLLGALWHRAIMQCRYHDIKFVEIRPKEAKATGIYKVWSKTTKSANMSRLTKANEYGCFQLITKKDGSINESAMEHQDNMIDAVGIWLAGWQKYE
jgi:hypothetical protein